MTPDQRARNLLMSHLSPQQMQTFEKHGWFEVVGAKTRRTYRIYRGDRADLNNMLISELADSHSVGFNIYIGRNVTWMQKGRRMASFCAYPYATIPNCDKLLAQKLALEDVEGEDKFLNMACKTWHSNRARNQLAFWPWGALRMTVCAMFVLQGLNLGWLLWRIWHP